jgi:MEMO1 family protein
MDIIETLKPDLFNEYIRKYQNTVCGRHPIGVFMQSIAALARQDYPMTFKFLRYAQSNQVTTQSDSSVSYASGSLITA